tara:strand:- start:1058 stop:1480 length:423 start_codon:yes stop_codon:yes gene_type:complete
MPDVSDFSYQLLITQVLTLSAELAKLEKLVPVPNQSELSSPFSKNIYLGLRQEKSDYNSLPLPKCPSIEVDNCEDIYYISDNSTICNNYYMQWNHNGNYCGQYVKCKAKLYSGIDFSNCGVDLDSSCNKSYINGEWRQFI